MRIRNMTIAVLLLLIAFTPLAATGLQENVEPAEREEDVRPVEPQEEPGETEEDDPLAPPEEEPIDPEVEDPVVPEEEEPWDTDDREAIQVISEHERTASAYDLFGDEFAEVVDYAPRVAYFIPSDEALAQVEPVDLTELEREQLARRHVAAGLVADQPLEFIDSFLTMDGETIEVGVDPQGRPVLNGVVTVIETIQVGNGFVYIIDGVLDDATLGLLRPGEPEFRTEEPEEEDIRIEEPEEVDGTEGLDEPEDLDDTEL